MRRIFVAGIGTDVGKTVVSAVLVESLRADYFKPVQAGNLDFSDSSIVSSLISNPQSSICPENVLLKEPMSPHAAAAIEGRGITLDDLKLPTTDRDLIIEGAGGLLVPLSDDLLVIDLISHFNASVLLVSNNYLGSINHTLLSLEAIKARGLKLEGIVFTGEASQSTESIISKISGAKVFGRIPLDPRLSKADISKFTSMFESL